MNATRFSFGPVNRLIFEDSLRTAMAAVASFLIARLLQMPEAYWATISAIIVAQSSLGAAATISWQRLAGTGLGAGLGALLATYFHTNLWVFGLGIFLLGLICALLRLGAAYRFSGVTLAVIMLIPRDKAAWRIAEHRLIEVSVGIAIGLALSGLWPKASPRVREEDSAASFH
jgi:uncharacterized membrane protein YgaE (UPF0421/DUF939 family)